MFMHICGNLNLGGRVRLCGGYGWILGGGLLAYGEVTVDICIIY